MGGWWRAHGRLVGGVYAVEYGGGRENGGYTHALLWKINVADAFKKYTSRSKLEAEAAPSTRQGQVQVQV